MPSQSVTLDESHYQYILATKDGESFSARVRELVDKGIEVEGNEE